jgi:hypothetical protein
MPSDDLVKYFIENTNKRFDDLEVKVDKLISLRWMLIGAASVMSVVVTVVIEVAKAIAGGR